MVSIKIKAVNSEHEAWLLKNVGPRLHYLHNSIGGEGWLCKKVTEEYSYYTVDGDLFQGKRVFWNVSFENESFATWFRLMFPND